MTLTPKQRQSFERALTDANTLLENYFWGWMLGYSSAEQYFEEVSITDLAGPGHERDEFVGTP